MADGLMWRCIATGMLLAALSGCAPARDADDGEGLHFEVAFVDRLRPDILERSGNALRDSDTSTPGFWGVVPDLRRAERAEVRNLATDASVTVALFAGSTGYSDIAIRLSPQAADALGVLEAPVPVRITAVRHEPEIVQ
jgi:hypothetical protein